MFQYLKNFFSKKQEPHQVPEYIILSVDNFNTWFNNPNNNAVYAHPGIFLRIDKLSLAHILDYIEKCYGISHEKSSEKYDVYKFLDEIRLNWKRKILWRQKLAGRKNIAPIIENPEHEL